MKTLIFLFLVTLVGCVVRPTPIPTVTILSPALPRPDAELRSPGQLKAYQVGAYVDPANPGVLHQAHSVYVEEHSPSWNLNSPAAAAGVLKGPNPVPVDSALSSERTRDELLAELSAQRKTSKALENHSAMLLDLVHSIGPQLKSVEQLRIAQKELQGAVDLLSTQIRSVPTLSTNGSGQSQSGTNVW